MNFSKYIKKLKLVTLAIKYVPIDTIKCQYNPDRYRFWERACGPSLDIKNGPFWEYLMYKKLDKYNALFKGYGRSETWITNNILKFQQMSVDISKNGYGKKKDLPIVLEVPVIANTGHNSLECYEGHRRLSICLYLGLKQRVRLCRIV